MPEWEAGELDNDSLDNLRAFKADNAGREVGIVYTKFYAKESVIGKLQEMVIQSLPKYVAENKGLEIIELI